MEAFRRYLTWGGMPAAARMADGEERAADLKRLYTEVYFKDIIERHSIREDLVLSIFVDILSSDIGSLFDERRPCWVKGFKPKFGYATSWMTRIAV